MEEVNKLRSGLVMGKRLIQLKKHLNSRKGDKSDTFIVYIIFQIYRSQYI